MICRQRKCTRKQKRARLFERRERHHSPFNHYCFCLRTGKWLTSQTRRPPFFRIPPTGFNKADDKAWGCSYTGDLGVLLLQLFSYQTSKFILVSVPYLSNNPFVFERFIDWFQPHAFQPILFHHTGTLNLYGLQVDINTQSHVW